jgi:hypothetical protein
MATTAYTRRRDADNPGLFLGLALAMAAVIAFGFSLQLAMGRSSFGAPLWVHVHALTFFGWVVLFVVQTTLIAAGQRPLHRWLGWVGAGWSVAIVVVGTLTTIWAVRLGRTPFFFTPAFFIILNPASALAFLGLTMAGVAQRRNTGWHRRLIVCGMAELTGPGYGRFVPAPLVIPYAGWVIFAAILAIPVVGAAIDWRRRGRLHPAWVWGVGTIVAVHIALVLVSSSPIGSAVYRAVTAGTPEAKVDPQAYPPPPWAVQR